MRIKHAYNTLLTSKSGGKYDSRKQGSDYSYSTGGYQTKTREAEEEFYGLGKRLASETGRLVYFILIPCFIVALKGKYFQVLMVSRCIICTLMLPGG